MFIGNIIHSGFDLALLYVGEINCNDKLGSLSFAGVHYYYHSSQNEILSKPRDVTADHVHSDQQMSPRGEKFKAISISCAAQRPHILENHRKKYVLST